MLSGMVVILNNRLVPTRIVRTTILFSVSVPVLSEQMSVTAPKRSSAPNLRTMHFSFAMRRTDTVMATVMTAINDSGEDSNTDRCSVEQSLL